MGPGTFVAPTRVTAALVLAQTGGCRVAGLSETDQHATHDKPQHAFTDGLSLSERAHDEIEHRIATCELAPGASLSEKRLSSALGIGRTPIREALQRLSREGMVRVLPRRYIQVSTIDVHSQLLLLEVRREIARVVARSAAVRATDEERSAIEAIASDMAAAVEVHDELDFMRLDRVFDRLLGRATHNEFASAALDVTSGLLRRFWFVNRTQGEQNLEAMMAHRAGLVSAVMARDPEAASAASDALLDYVESFARTSASPEAVF
ncbi:MAG: GntR family transcriptional regulator [Gammaproteobacteria bacterium]